MSRKAATERRPGLDGFVDDYGHPVFSDPQNVGSVEYQAIHALLSDLLDDMDVPLGGAALSYTAAELVLSLEAIEGWASVLRARLRPLS